MTAHFKDNNCSGGDGCKLSTFHGAVTSLNTNKVNNVFFLDKYPVQNAALNTKTRGQQRYRSGSSRDLCNNIQTRAIKDENVKIIELT